MWSNAFCGGSIGLFGGLFRGQFGGLFNLLLLSFLFVAGMLALQRLFRRTETGRRGGADRDHSLEILKRKFANKEISEEEYLRMRAILDA